MDALRLKSLAPFVPSGKDYAASRRLFAALGFRELWENGGFAGFQNGEARFILQDFHNDAFAQNLMLRIEVENLDAWWVAIAALGLERAYPGVKLKPPTDFPWGREVHLIDLAGVCWHIGTP